MEEQLDNTKYGEKKQQKGTPPLLKLDVWKKYIMFSPPGRSFALLCSRAQLCAPLLKAQLCSPLLRRSFALLSSRYSLALLSSVMRSNDNDICRSTCFPLLSSLGSSC